MKNILLLLVGAALFVVLIVFRPDLPNVIALVSEKISWTFYILIVLLITIQLPLRSLRFKILLDTLVKDSGISLLDSFMLTSASFFIALASPNKSGDMLRGLLHTDQRWEITAISMLEYLFDCLVVLLVPLLGIFMVYGSYSTQIAIGYLGISIGLALVFVIFRYFPVENILSNFHYYRNNKSGIRLLKTYLGKGLRSKYTWFIGVLFTCLFYGLYFLIFYAVLHRLGAQITVLEIIVSAGVGVFVGSLTFIPMGMGTRDASIFGLLLSMGTNSEIAMSSVIIMRSLSIPIICVSGLCYFISISRFK